MPGGNVGDEPEEMGRLRAHVERQASLAEQVERLMDGGVLEEVWIGVAVHQVPDANDGLVLPKIEERLGGPGVPERYPSDDPCDLCVGPRRAQHVLGVLDVVAGLHEHDLPHPDGGLLGPELGQLTHVGQLGHLA